MSKMSETEINEIVARKLGWKMTKDFQWWKYEGMLPLKYPRNYSTSIEAAWEIVQQFVAKDISIDLSYQKDAGWRFHYGAMVGEIPRGESAPLSICKAFLKLP